VNVVAAGSIATASPNAPKPLCRCRTMCGPAIPSPGVAIVRLRRPATGAYSAADDRSGGVSRGGPSQPDQIESFRDRAGLVTACRNASETRLIASVRPPPDTRASRSSTVQRHCPICGCGNAPPAGQPPPPRPPWRWGARAAARRVVTSRRSAERPTSVGSAPCSHPRVPRARGIVEAVTEVRPDRRSQPSHPSTSTASTRPRFIGTRGFRRRCCGTARGCRPRRRARTGRCEDGWTAARSPP
jgi:hypothetical protein